MTKLSLLRSLEAGWAGPGSLPMNETSAKRFAALVAEIGNDRYRDAEPVLTDAGLIRLEWEARGFSYSVEIGETSLYMCALAPNPDDDDDDELDHYDHGRLLAFFLDGRLR